MKKVSFEMITFIDLDGVLADFYSGVHKYMEIEVDGFPYESGWYWTNEILANYKEFPVDFWSNLPLYKDYQTQFDMSQGKVIITTSPCGPHSLVGKLEWVNRYFPHLQVIFIKDKSLLAGPDRLLIDDNVMQVNAFSKAGGTGILVRRPWNE